MWALRRYSWLFVIVKKVEKVNQRNLCFHMSCIQCINWIVYPSHELDYAIIKLTFISLKGVIIVKSLFFIYESTAEWEAAPAAFVLSRRGEIDTFGLDTKPVKGYCKLPLKPEKTINQSNPQDYDALIIPGGHPKEFEGREDLFELIRTFHSQNKVIGAICGGPVALFWADVLKDKQFTCSVSPDDYEGFDFTHYVDEYAVTDGNIITAKGEGFTEFALHLGDSLDIFKDNEREQVKGLFRHP